MESASGASILIVDDTVENLRLLSSMLSTRGYDVRPVTSGSQALRAAELEPPDLVLLDVTMPEMDGYEVCRRLKQLDGVKGTPVIFLTALSETADKVKAFDAGGVDYVTKPFQLEEVLSRVNAHVALGRARTALQESYVRLQSLERLRDDLVHMIVHDMRSPLAVVMAHLDLALLGEPAALTGEIFEDLREAMKAARVLNRMTNELLDVSRLEQGKMPIERTACDLVEIARAVVKNLAAWDRERTIEVDAMGPIEVVCDAQLVQRVIENFISNAIKHTPPGGRIRVTVERKPKAVRLAVQDEGPGVPIEERARIFEKFETASPRQNRKFHSAGVGLAFCKMAVEAHGGSVGVDAGETGGSVFWFDVPS